MPQNNWIATSHGNYSTAGNWSQGRAPTGDDVAVFSGNAFNCIVDQNVDCSGITVSGAYTGNITATGYAFYINGTVNDSGTGARHYGSGIIMNGGSSSLILGSTLGTVTGTNSAFTFNAGGQIFTDNKAVSISGLIIGANASLTSNGSAQTILSGKKTILTLGDSSTFTCSAPLQFYANANQTIMSLGAGSIFNGTGAIRVVPGASNVISTIPALTYTGSGAWTIINDYSGTVTLAGVFNIGANNLTLKQGAGNITFNTNNNNITCGTLTIDHAADGNTLTANFGSSTINILLYASTIKSTTQCFVNFESSTINCSGNWTFSNYHIIDPGTSIVNILKTSTITSANKAFYDFNINTDASGTVVTFVDSPRISGDFTVTQGSTNLSDLNWSGYGDILFDGQGSHTVGSGITMMGSGTTLRFGNSEPNFNTAGCYVKCNENTTFAIGNKTINRLGLTTGKTYTFSVGSPVLRVATYTAADWDGATLVSSSPTSQWGLNMVPSISVNNVTVTDSDNSTGTQIDASAVTNVNGGNNLNWLFATVTPTASGVALIEMRFYNPFLHTQYIAKGRRVLRAVQRYIGS